jgi:hypothetical protein
VIRMSCPGLPRARARYAQAPRVVQPILRRGVELKTAALKRSIEPLIPVRSGRTRSALTREFRNITSARITGAVTFRAMPGSPDVRLLALWLDRGTKPHLILPRRVRMLRWEVSGTVRFAKSVMHPGTRGARFMSRGRMLALPTLRRIDAAMLAQVTRRLGSGI